MSELVICPPPAATVLHPDDRPHHGFGITTLVRNGRRVESWVHYDEVPSAGELAERCQVRRGVGFKLCSRGPLSYEVYHLRSGQWVLVEKGKGFA